jgi:hypothetical protein
VTIAVNVAESPYITDAGATLSVVVDVDTAPTLWPVEPVLLVEMLESGV